MDRDKRYFTFEDCILNLLVKILFLLNILQLLTEVYQNNYSWLRKRLPCRRLADIYLVFSSLILSKFGFQRVILLVVKYLL